MVRVFPPFAPEKAEVLLHGMTVPVIARISRDGLLFSARTLFEENLEEIADAVRALYDQAGGQTR